MTSIRAVVVGGTNGIGYAMACRIAASSSASSSIIVSGRTKPATLPQTNMEFRRLDASSMREIKRYTDELKASGPKLDLLVMTQGILTFQGRTETPEGIDQKMSLHYYGKQLLIRELLPFLNDAARVIIVLDGTRGSPSKLIWDDLDLKKNYSLQKAADHCVSMNDGMVQYWAKAQPDAPASAKWHFIHAYPGAVNTNIFNQIAPSFLRRPLNALSSLALTSPETCAERLLDGTEQRVAEGTKEGRFWSNIDNKGKSAENRAIWTEEQITKLTDHTWSVADTAPSVKK